MTTIPCPGCGDAPGRCTYCTPDEQPDPMTVTGKLRWEGNYLYLGPHSLGVVTRYGKVWDAYPHGGNITRNHPTKAAARDALVQAVKEGIGS